MNGPIRQEFVLAGCLLVAGGLIAAIVGFDQVQQTPLENAVSIIERVSASPAPPALHPSKTGGYVVLLVGLLSFASGVVLILKSRISGSNGSPTGNSHQR